MGHALSVGRPGARRAVRVSSGHPHRTQGASMTQAGTTFSTAAKTTRSRMATPAAKEALASGAVIAHVARSSR
jgi:hypothetical protein